MDTIIKIDQKPLWAKFGFMPNDSILALNFSFVKLAQALFL